jgi:hypothetical protein
MNSAHDSLSARYSVRGIIISVVCACCHHVKANIEHLFSKSKLARTFVLSFNAEGAVRNDEAHQATHQAMTGQKSKRLFVHYLAIYGCISTALIYLGIGIVAILSFLKIVDGGADEGSLLAVLNNHIVGYILVCIILLGTASYIVWRIYEALTDPYGYGKDKRGTALRTGITLSTIADALIAYSAITALFGTSTANEDGRPTALRESVTALMEQSGGWLIICIGVIVSATALAQLIYGLAKGYRERLGIGHLKRWIRNSIYALGWAGYSARAIILGIIGFFFIKAGISGNARHVVNTDKAFDFIGDNVGHAAFILVAAGTICYALFMFMFGIYYDTEKDQR